MGNGLGTLLADDEHFHARPFSLDSSHAFGY